MSRAFDLLKMKENQLSDALAVVLQERAYDNRYSLHPRRLEELGNEFCQAFLHFLETTDRTAAIELGIHCAQVGLGEKTVPALLACLQRSTFEACGMDMPATITVNQFAAPLFEGFMAERENQILQDQEQLRRALSTALENQSRELLIKNYAISTSINGIMLTDLDGTVTWVNASSSPCGATPPSPR
jgi:hypothetical protein